MNRESFLETIRAQYAEEVQAVYVECEHEEKIDFGALHAKLSKLMKNAKVDGLPQKDFIELVNSTLNADVVKILAFDKAESKAA